MTIKTVKYTSPQVGSTTANPSIVEGSETIGGQPTLLIADLTTRQLLEAILIELKIMNLRQQEAFEETVNEEDLTCE